MRGGRGEKVSMGSETGDYERAQMGKPKDSGTSEGVQGKSRDIKMTACRFPIWIEKRVGLNAHMAKSKERLSIGTRGTLK